MRIGDRLHSHDGISILPSFVRDACEATGTLVFSRGKVPSKLAAKYNRPFQPDGNHDQYTSRRFSMARPIKPLSRDPWDFPGSQLRVPSSTIWQPGEKRPSVLNHRPSRIQALDLQKRLLVNQSLHEQCSTKKSKESRTHESSRTF
jgi:hypothetical protein